MIGPVTWYHLPEPHPELNDGVHWDFVDQDYTRPTVPPDHWYRVTPIDLAPTTPKPLAGWP